MTGTSTAATAAGIRPALIGPYGPAQIACLRSWRRLGLTPLFIHVGDHPLPLGRHVAAACLHLPPDLIGTMAGAKRLTVFLDREKASGLTCLAESLAAWINDLSGAESLPPGVAPWVPGPEALTRLSSKAAQCDAAVACGLPVLPRLAVGRDDAATVPADAFPLVLRPDDTGAAAPGFKVRLVPDRAALSAFLGGLRRLDRPLVGQRLVVGPNLVVHGARTPQGEVFALTAFRADRKFEGVTLRIRPAALDPALAVGCARFAEAMGVTGCFHFEFIEDRDGHPWFLEMNGRLGGTTGKVFALGYDEPRHHLAAFEPALRAGTPDRLASAATAATARQAVVRATLLHLRGRQDPLDYPVLTRGQAVAEAAAGLLWWREETWRPLAWPVTTLAYLLARVTRRRRPTAAAAAGPLGKEPQP